MTTFHVSNHRKTTLLVDGVNDRWVIDDTGGISVTITPAIDIASTADSIKVEIDGKVSSPGFCIDDKGTDTEIEIGKSGRVTGLRGIYSVDAATIVQRGDLLTDGNAITTNANTLIQNYGLIQASTENAVKISEGRFENRGQVRAGNVAFNAADNSTTAQLVNYGSIDGDKYAVWGGAAGEIVVNKGVMKGRILLNYGDDIFDNRGGRIDHDVEGGNGDDTLWVSSGADRLKEDFGDGYDTVRSSDSYTLAANVEHLVLLGARALDGKGNSSINSIEGNSGDNKLFGLGGNDWLDGRKGDDRLTGGLGDQDTFIFAAGYGHDVVTDFEDGTDILDLSGMNNIMSFSDLHTKNSPDGLIIQAGADRLLVEGLTKAQFDVSDVVLV